jgi:pimeloyl-ACP methyl ester carboxylesterase
MPIPRQSGPENLVRQVINDVGHLINLEAPATVNKHLLNFLQNLSTIKLHHPRLQKVA